MGGNGRAGYRRSVTHGHGWYGFNLTVEQSAAAVQGIREARSQYERPGWLGDRIEVSVTPRGPVDAAAVAAYAAAGVDRLILLPSGRATRDELLHLVEDSRAFVG